jgi:Spy/CpxP family protein refolding chaperone
MKKRVLTIVAALGLSSALLFASGYGDRDGRGMPKDRMMENIKKLDLTVEQKAKLMDIRDARRSDRQAHKEMMRNNRAAMQPPIADLSLFMTKEKFDKEAFKVAMKKDMEAKEAARAAMRQTMIDKRADHVQEIFDLLTPEQREKLISLSKVKE